MTLASRVRALELARSTNGGRRFCVACAVAALDDRQAGPAECDHAAGHNLGLPTPRGFSAADALTDLARPASAHEGMPA